MQAAAPFLILGLTISLSISRPTIGSLRIHHSYAGVIGALLTVIFGLVSLKDLELAFEVLSLPIVTIISLMVITLIAEESGFFSLIARRVAILARGSGRRLFALLFMAGTVTGTFFTNDAAVLIFTPLVFNLVEEIQGRNWTLKNKIPFYIGVLYVANLVGALVISNPINLVTASILNIGFGEYAVWMFLPALVSMIVSFLGLKLFFGVSIPETFELPAEKETENRHSAFRLTSAIVLGLTLVGFMMAAILGLPVWGVALASAVLLTGARSFATRRSFAPIARGIGWDVIIFVVGIFIVALGVRNMGFAQQVGDALMNLTAGQPGFRLFATGLTAAIGSAILDNHPTADLMSWVIRDMNLPAHQTKVLGYAALIGGDLGPKMSPIGSLAALMWLRLLRDKGVEIPYRLFLRVNIPITIAAVLASLGVLATQVALFQR